MEKSFKELGYVVIPDLFPLEKCQQYADEMVKLWHNNKLSTEQQTDPRMYKNSFGIGSLPFFEAELKPIGDHIMSVLGIKMKPANSYARVYTNGSTLPKHVDRPGLDYTLSISLYSNLDNPWLFYATGLDKKDIGFEIPIGAGGFIYGRDIVHWRDPLVCQPTQYVVQLFLHWGKI